MNMNSNLNLQVILVNAKHTGDLSGARESVIIGHDAGKLFAGDDVLACGKTIHGLFDGKGIDEEATKEVVLSFPLVDRPVGLGLNHLLPASLGKDEDVGVGDCGGVNRIISGLSVGGDQHHGEFRGQAADGEIVVTAAHPEVEVLNVDGRCRTGDVGEVDLAGRSAADGQRVAGSRN